jgi:penicillin amidase
MRTVWSEPGGAGYFNASWMFGATKWDDFEIAHQRWGAPPLNLVYADTHGDIGWRASAFVPKRKGWDGLMPVPGDGRYEWQGMVRPDDLPVIKNPARGWVATANQMNLDKGYDSTKQPIGYEWVDRSRIDRIETLLSAKPKLSLADMEAIQTDATSPLAARSAAVVEKVGGLTGDAARAAALLHGWNGYEGVDSAQAALYEIWIARHLRKALAEAVVTPELQSFFADASVPGVIDWLAALDPRLGADPAAVRDKVVGVSLAGAWVEANKLLGPDPKNGAGAICTAPIGRPRLPAWRPRWKTAMDGGAATDCRIGFDPGGGHLSRRGLCRQFGRVGAHGAGRGCVGQFAHHQYAGPVG